MIFTISTVAVVLRVWNFPIPYQFWLKLELAVFHDVGGGVNEVHDANANARTQGFNGSRNEMNGFVGITDVRQVHHRGERFSVVNVGHTSTVLVPGWPAVRLAVVVKVEEIHPQTNLRGSPATHERITKAGSTRGGVNGVSFR